MKIAFFTGYFPGDIYGVPRYALMRNGKIIVTTPSAVKLRGRSPMPRIKSLVLCASDKPPKKRETSIRIGDKTLPHRDFTRSELKGLLTRFFRVIKVQSVSFGSLYDILKICFPMDSILKLIHYLDMAISEILLISLLGEYWLAICEKRKQNGDNSC